MYFDICLIIVIVYISVIVIASHYRALRENESSYVCNSTCIVVIMFVVVF